MYQHPPQTSVPITREGFLLTPGRPVIQGQYNQTDSPTTSSSRLRWVQLLEWINFPANFAEFWQTLRPGEKSEYITNTAFLAQYGQFSSTLAHPTNETMLADHLGWKYSQPHNWAARPSGTMAHAHARIIPRDEFYQLIGRPDYLFVEPENSPNRGFYAVMELKTFWKVTPDKIVEVLNGTAPIATSHSGRLAIEQIYGYMVRNAKRYGILTTVNGWIFLMRENGGRLFMTRVIDCQCMHPSFTILQALYYISALAIQSGHLVETDSQGNPVQIELADSKYPVAAPSVTGSSSSSAMSSSLTPVATVVWPPESRRQYGLAERSLRHGILLEPWVSTNYCGGKSFRALLMPERKPVIVKLWDGYKSAGDLRDQEVQIYMVLHELWGKQIPMFICSATIDFCYGIILDEGSQLSPENFTEQVKRNILAAYEAIHKLRVTHVDVRKENILVLEDQSVRIIDFENSSMVSGDGNFVEAFHLENDVVISMLSTLEEGLGCRGGG